MQNSMLNELAISMVSVATGGVDKKITTYSNEISYTQAKAIESKKELLRFISVNESLASLHYDMGKTDLWLTLYQNLEILLNSKKALSDEKIKLEYEVEIRELKSIFEINEGEVSVNLLKRMEDTSMNNVVKELDLRLCIFWRKIYILLRNKDTTKNTLANECFEFISAMISLIKKDFSKYASLVMILFMLFHFEQVSLFLSFLI